jgi:hypothetical protein
VHFLRDPDASRLLKYLFFYGGVDAVDDVVFPGIGFIDEPYFLVYPLVLVAVLRKIRHYR